MFTVEEMNLIQAMDHTCRRMSIFDMKTSIPNIEDAELKVLCERTLRKVSVWHIIIERVRKKAQFVPSFRFYLYLCHT